MDPLEGFLFPGTYPAAKGMKPEAILETDGHPGQTEVRRLRPGREGQGLGLKNAFDLVTVASLVQAEGKTTTTSARWRRWSATASSPPTPRPTGCCSSTRPTTTSRARATSHLREGDQQQPSPYNTYRHPGLPPGPIGNPGEDALKATLNPTDDGWIYFVATDGTNNTEFAKTYAEFPELKDKFNANAGN
ncbi:endolytic transglycosylase MltG [Streptomyces tricolor]|nr:endolytic transglycosylase MltG [Streptomyces tricolor]